MPNLTNHSIRRMHERIGVTRGVAKNMQKKFSRMVFSIKIQWEN